MVSSANTKSSNLKIIKRTLLEPQKFRNTNFLGRACFSYNYKKYGSLESWESALNLLNNLPDNENIFNELIMESSKVKPYLDIEWMKNEYPDLDPDFVKVELRKAIKKIFNREWSINLTSSDILFAKCHRPKDYEWKYSFHVIVSTKPQVVFLNANLASVLAVKLAEECSFGRDIVDTSVYKRTQNIRLVGHTKFGENYPFLAEEGEAPINYVITNIGDGYTVIDTHEQEDKLYRSIQNKRNIDLADDSEQCDLILEKVKEIHPTAYLERCDSSGFLQFNYTDRREPCFTCSEPPITHERIGFFAYIYQDSVCIGCHSGNCVDYTNKKVIKIIGSYKPKTTTFDKVEESNSFNIPFNFIEECVMDGAIGISNLFKEMYLSPKRIKWVNSDKNGISYYWNGKLWEDDDYSYIARLLSVTTVRVLRNFAVSYRSNNEILSDAAELRIKMAEKLVDKLNNGTMLATILNFIRPLVRDPEFAKIKDIHPNFLSCKNGMLDLFSGKLRASVPDDNITRCIDTIFDDSADCSDFDKFVRQITSNEEGPDEELYTYLRWCIGYALQGNPKKKMFFILYGPYGFNGKSLLLNTISDVLEHYAVAMDKSVVLEGPKKTSGSHSTELVHLENSRFGLLSDTSENSTIDDGQMKQLTGVTDKLSVREIFGKQKEFIPRFVPFISTNHMIRINLSDKAMYERLVILPFMLSFVACPSKRVSYERQGNDSLAEQFKKNKKGTLRWLVDCSVFYNQNQDLPVPACIKSAKEDYNKQVNMYLNFIEKNIIFDTEASLKTEDLLYQYKMYVRDNGLKYSANSSEKEFDKLYKSMIINNKKHYAGIKLREEEATADMIELVEL